MPVFRFLGISLAWCAMLALPACMTTAPTAVHQPMTARPAPVVNASATTGAIFGSNSRPLFEDRRARYVGDTITVNLVEKTQASKSSNASADRGAKIDIGTPTLSGLPLKSLNKLGVTADDTSTFSGKGAAAANNAFTGTMTVTVIDTYPNGNLLVSGEKQIAINQGQEFIRFSGVVNPANVTSANTVQSTQVADARVEYKASGYMDEAQTMGWLQRFFLNVMPW